MGMSFTATAHKQLEKVVAHCRKTMGSANEWLYQGHTLFFEQGPQQADDAICGRIYENKAGKSFLVGVFRIEADGCVTAFPFLSPTFFQ